jgi:hypothetical protein
MPIVGEVHLDGDGVMHGWCWDSTRPAERVTVQIELDETPVVILVASRFRDDLRERGYGDGYHAFMAALTRQLAQTQHPSLVQVREQKTGICFWQKLLGEFSIPADFAQTLAAARGDLAALAQSPALCRTAAFSTRLQASFAACGARLHQAAPEPLAFTLPASKTPRLSVVLDAGADATVLLTALRSAAPRLGETAAEFILTDAGENPEILAQTAQVQNLCYLRGSANGARRRNQAADLARGGALVFLDHAQGRLAAALASLNPTQLVIAPELAGAISRIAPALTQNLPQIDGPALGLRLACPTALFRTLGGFDPAMDDGAGLDFVDFALRAGAPMGVWRTAGPAVAATPQNADAGQHFVRRWLQR